MNLSTLTETQLNTIVRLSKELGVPVTIGIEVPEVRQIIYNDPATIVYWKDGSKTVVKCTENDTYSPTTGLALCVMKKVYGDQRYKKMLKDLVSELKFPLNH